MAMHTVPTRRVSLSMSIEFGRGPDSARRSPAGGWRRTPVSRLNDSVLRRQALRPATHFEALPLDSREKSPRSGGLSTPAKTGELRPYGGFLHPSRLFDGAFSRGAGH